MFLKDDLFLKKGNNFMTRWCDISNEVLFKLQEISLRAPVLEFLKSKTFPWELLGKPLQSFVEEQVSKIPLEDRLKGSIHPTAVLGRDVVVEEGAIIDPHVYIEGPAFIEKKAVVRQGAYIRSHVYLCEGAVIGHTSEAKGCLLLPHAKAAHFAYVGDSIMGVETNLGAGTKFANLRLDHGLISIFFQNERRCTGLKKFGAILGNHAQTGCNSVLNPGTILGPSFLVLPNQTATGVKLKKN